MGALRDKSEKLTAYLEHLVLEAFGDRELIVTPATKKDRGAQLSFAVPGPGREVIKGLRSKGVICDFREPNIVRAAPVPLYNSFSDVQNFVSILKESVDEHQ